MRMGLRTFWRFLNVLGLLSFGRLHALVDLRQPRGYEGLQIKSVEKDFWDLGLQYGNDALPIAAAGALELIEDQALLGINFNCSLPRLINCASEIRPVFLDLSVQLGLLSECFRLNEWRLSACSVSGFAGVTQTTQLRVMLQGCSLNSDWRTAWKSIPAISANGLVTLSEVLIQSNRAYRQGFMDLQLGGQVNLNSVCQTCLPLSQALARRASAFQFYLLPHLHLSLFEIDQYKLRSTLINPDWLLTCELECYVKSFDRVALTILIQRPWNLGLHRKNKWIIKYTLAFRMLNKDSVRKLRRSQFSGTHLYMTKQLVTERMYQIFPQTRYWLNSLVDGCLPLENFIPAADWPRYTTDETSTTVPSRELTT